MKGIIVEGVVIMVVAIRGMFQEMQMMKLITQHIVLLLPLVSRVTVTELV